MLSPPESEAGIRNRAAVFDGLSVELRPASFAKRIGAYIVDLGIIYGLLYLSFVLLFVVVVGLIGLNVSLTQLWGSDGSSSLFGMLTALIMVLLLLSLLVGIYHGYFVYFEYTRGYTVGKKLFGLKVISLDGSRLTLAQCLIRDQMRYIDAMLIFPGLLSMVLSSQRRRLGDLMMGTMVVHSAHKEESSQFLYIGQDDYYMLLEALQPEPVPPEICDTYLRFAYSHFIMNSRQFTLAAQQEWRTLALRFLRGPQAANMDNQTILLFFAELCFQSVNKR